MFDFLKLIFIHSLPFLFLYVNVSDIKLLFSELLGPR